MRKSIIMLCVKLRWAYFHLNPYYLKFYMDEGRTEAHFQHIKTGVLHSNLVWVGKLPNAQKVSLHE